MSTIDPDAARREREAAVPTSRELVPLALVAFVQPALAALLISRMLTNAEDNVFDGTSVLALVVTFPGAGATILAIIRWAVFAQRNPRLLDVSAPIGLVLLGAALGVSVAAPPPGWIQAPSANITAMILGILGLLTLGYALVGHTRRVRGIAHDKAIMRGSAPVEGVVTNQGYGLAPTDVRAILTTVTYAFVDAAGTRRYVRRGERIPMTDLLVDGEKVDVWFDRQDPSNVKRIVIRRREPGRR